MRERRNSIANALELRLSGTNPLICIVIKLYQCWLRWYPVSCSVQTYYLNQCWLIGNWALRNKILWKFNLKTKLIFQENAFKIKKVTCKMPAILFFPQCVNSLWRTSDVIFRHKCGSTLAQIMACCQETPSHYLNQCWLIISEVQWQLPEGNFTRAVNQWN